MQPPGAVALTPTNRSPRTRSLLRVVWTSRETATGDSAQAARGPRPSVTGQRLAFPTRHAPGRHRRRPGLATKPQASRARPRLPQHSTNDSAGPSPIRHSGCHPLTPAFMRRSAPPITRSRSFNRRSVHWCWGAAAEPKAPLARSSPLRPDRSRKRLAARRGPSGIALSSPPRPPARRW